MTGGCPKYNSELYISHEPKGPNFMLADTDLLPTKYHDLQDWGIFFLTSFCSLKICVTLLQKQLMIFLALSLCCYRPFEDYFPEYMGSITF